jgi:hypothetical protein
MSLGRQALGDEVLNNMSFLSQFFFLIVAFGKFRMWSLYFNIMYWKFNLALLVPIRHVVPYLFLSLISWLQWFQWIYEHDRSDSIGLMTYWRMIAWCKGCLDWCSNWPKIARMFRDQGNRVQTRSQQQNASLNPMTWRKGKRATSKGCKIEQDQGRYVIHAYCWFRTIPHVYALPVLILHYAQLKLAIFI